MQRDRPELKAALEYLRSGDTLAVWQLDRLARSMRQLIETVEDLHSRGIELRSLTESIDTATPGGRLVFHIFGALAEFERAVIRERTSAGLQAARGRGKKGGRPRTLEPKDLAALIRRAAFSPDGKRAVTASDDGTARVWVSRAARSYWASAATPVAFAASPSRPTAH